MSPVSVDNNVLFTATPTVGGTATHEYQFWYKSVTAPTFSMAQDYSPANTFTWKATAGSYEWKVFARSTGSTAVSEAVSPSIVPFVVNSLAATAPPATGEVVAALPASPAFVGDNVTFIGAASGGSGFYEYQFWFYTETDWSMVKDYNVPGGIWALNTTGLSSGVKYVELRARSAGSTSPVETYTTTDYPLTEYCTGFGCHRHF